MKTYIRNLELEGDFEWLDYLESLSFELESRKSLLAFLGSKQNLNQELIDRIFNEYQDFYIQYSVAKNNFETDYVRQWFPQAVNWDLSFATKNLTVQTNEDDAHEEIKN